MMLHDKKKQIRFEISSLKKSYGKVALVELSTAVMQRLESTVFFKQASCVALYHSLPDEVSTISFIEKWVKYKTILLPVVQGNELQFFPYFGRESLKMGAFGIMEPKENSYKKMKPDLIVVPGVAFDRKGNRLGRGKGFYDRFLSKLDVKTVGICFDFQLIEEVPVEAFDKKMDMVVSESETIER